MKKLIALTAILLSTSSMAQDNKSYDSVMPMEPARDILESFQCGNGQIPTITIYRHAKSFQYKLVNGELKFNVNGDSECGEGYRRYSNYCVAASCGVSIEQPISFDPVAPIFDN